MIMEMTTTAPQREITPKLVEALYLEAMALADSARRYFDVEGAKDRGALDPLARVTFSCESLRVTTRLMHVVAWLMVRKAVEARELTPDEAAEPTRRLGRATDVGSPDVRLDLLPTPARNLMAASIDLYGRVKRLDAQLGGDAPDASDDARARLDRLHASI